MCGLNPPTIVRNFTLHLFGRFEGRPKFQKARSPNRVSNPNFRRSLGKNAILTVSKSPRPARKSISRRIAILNRHNPI